MAEDAPVTVLIVDDELDMRTLVRVVLEAADVGIEVAAEAVDGQEAVEMFDQLAPPPVPSIVILDNRMPFMTGLEAARMIRSRLPVQHIILFSAFLTDRIRKEAQEIGVDACVSKTDLSRLPSLVMELTRPPADDPAT